MAFKVKGKGKPLSVISEGDKKDKRTGKVVKGAVETKVKPRPEKKEDPET